MLDPRSIQLTDEQKDQLAAAANSLGKDWSEVLAEAIKKATELANRDGNKTTRFGAGSGSIVISPDFDEPLPEFRDYTE